MRTVCTVNRRLAALVPIILLAGCGKRDAAGTNRPGNASTPGPAPGHSRFVNSPEGLTGNLARHYVDFWFDYPAGCEVLRQGRGNEHNFVRVNRRGADGQVSAQLNVGNFWSDRPDTTAAMEALVQDIKAAVTRNLTRAEVVSERGTKLGPYDCHEVTVRHQVLKPMSRDVDVWLQTLAGQGGEVHFLGPNGERIPVNTVREQNMSTETWTTRLVILPQPGSSRRGVVLTALTREGESLDAILNTFRFGKP